MDSEEHSCEAVVDRILDEAPDNVPNIRVKVDYERDEESLFYEIETYEINIDTPFDDGVSEPDEFKQAGFIEMSDYGLGEDIHDWFVSTFVGMDNEIPFMYNGEVVTNVQNGDAFSDYASTGEPSFDTDIVDTAY